MKRAILLIAALGIGASAISATTATVTPGVWDGYRGSTIVTQDAPNEAACVQALKALNVTRNYTCRTRTTVAVVVTVDPPTAVDCVVSDWSAWDGGAWSACSNGSQTRTETRTRSVTTPASNGGAACPALTETRAASQACTVDPPPVDPPPAGSLTFTDALSYPSCATVRRYTYNAVTHTNTLEYLTPDQAGVPIHAGNCFIATTADVKAKFTALKAGDWMCLKAGTYTGVYGEGDWYGNSNFETWKKGTSAQPSTVTACKDEVVTLKPPSRPALIFGNGDRASQYAAYLNFSGFKIAAGSSAVSGGGHTTQPSGGPDETGGRFISIVGNDISISDATGNTMTGLLDLQSDGWRVLGNSFHDPANRVVINNNHGVYVQGGSDNTEVAYNSFVGLHTGHVVQIHQDGTPKTYENVNVHDNYFRANNYTDMRGISVVNVSPSSTIFLTNNVLEHLGWNDWGCLSVYGGTVTSEGLSCTDVNAGINIYGNAAGYGGSFRKLILNNTKVCPRTGNRISFEQGSTSANLVETNLKACN